MVSQKEGKKYSNETAKTHQATEVDAANRALFVFFLVLAMLQILTTL